MKTELQLGIQIQRCRTHDQNLETEVQSKESKGVEFKGEIYGNRMPVRNPKFRDEVYSLCSPSITCCKIVKIYNFQQRPKATVKGC